MAEIDSRPAQIKELVERAEGFLSDAEFREDQESKIVRYFQAIATTLLAVAAQNEMIIELLSKQQAYGSLSNE
jgi:hypothetical protein